MKSFQDTFYVCRRVSTSFKEPCSPVFLNNYEQTKTKNFLHTFEDIAKDTVSEKNQREQTRLELVFLEVFSSLNKWVDFWKSYLKFIHNFSLQNQYNHIRRKFVLISKILKFTDTLIIVPDCFLIFWFCIKGHQAYYSWISNAPALLVSIQLLFSHCVKYVKIRALSDPYFPKCEQYRIRTGKYGYDSVYIRENTEQRKPVFRDILRSVLLNIFSHNLDHAKKMFFQCVKVIRARKLKVWK